MHGSHDVAEPRTFLGLTVSSAFRASPCLLARPPFCFARGAGTPDDELSESLPLEEASLSLLLLSLPLLLLESLPDELLESSDDEDPAPPPPHQAETPWTGRAQETCTATVS